MPDAKLSHLVSASGESSSLLLRFLLIVVKLHSLLFSLSSIFREGDLEALRI
ncbi:unnamed protein product [Arabidopsis halleri]